MKSPWRGTLTILLLATATLGSRAGAAHHEPWPSAEELNEEHSVEETARLRTLLWMTPLGLLVNDYLTQPGSPVAITARAHRITRRILSSGPLFDARLAALHLLREDLYENGRVQETTQLRLNQLDSEIEFKAHALRETATGNFIWHTIVPLAVGVLAGAYPVREQTLAVANTALKKLGPLYSRRWAAKLAHSRADLKNHFGEGKFLRHYNVFFAWAGFKITEEAYWKAYTFIETGVGDDESLLRHFVNLGVQSFSSIEYL